MKKWMKKTLITAAALYLPLSLTGAENLDWGIKGVGGAVAFEEEEQPLQIEPLMTATQKRAAAAQGYLMNKIDPGYIQTGGGALSSVVTIDKVTGAEVPAILFPEIDAPYALVNQLVPDNFNYKSPSSITLTFMTAAALPPRFVGNEAKFILSVTLAGKSLIDPQTVTLKISGNRSSGNTFSLKYSIPATSTKRISSETSPLVTFQLTRDNSDPTLFRGDLFLVGYQLSYQPLPN